MISQEITDRSNLPGLVALSACGGGAQGDTTDIAAPARVVAPAEPAPVVEPAAPPVPEQLQFTAQTVAAQPFDGTTLAGQDAVVWFWAPWCTECRREAPAVAAIEAATRGTVSFVGVGGLGPVGDMTSFIEQYGVGAFPHLNDADGEIWKGFGVTRQPAHAFINDDGTVEIVRGELSQAELEAKVAELATA
ncbi:MAG: redoxin domain-containing protein [Sporichthyaceae bacterium]